MRDFKPTLPYSVIATLQTSTETVIKGVTVKSYTTLDSIYVSFKSYGGTEINVNGTTVVEDTATVETWYRPDITSSSRLLIGSTTYEILGTPENINMSNQYLQFKVRAIKGGA